MFAKVCKSDWKRIVHSRPSPVIYESVSPAYTPRAILYTFHPQAQGSSPLKCAPPRGHGTAISECCASPEASGQARGIGLADAGDEAAGCITPSAALNGRPEYQHRQYSADLPADGRDPVEKERLSTSAGRPGDCNTRRLDGKAACSERPLWEESYYAQLTAQQVLALKRINITRVCELLCGLWSDNKLWYLKCPMEVYPPYYSEDYAANKEFKLKTWTISIILHKVYVLITHRAWNMLISAMQCVWMVATALLLQWTTVLSAHKHEHPGLAEVWLQSQFTDGIHVGIHLTPSRWGLMVQWQH